MLIGRPQIRRIFSHSSFLADKFSSTAGRARVSIQTVMKKVRVTCPAQYLCACNIYRFLHMYLMTMQDTSFLFFMNFNLPIALYKGFPVNLSHTISVSRWFVIPMVFTWDADNPKASNFSTHLSIQVIVEDSKMSASCSTHP